MHTAHSMQWYMALWVGDIYVGKKRESSNSRFVYTIPRPGSR